MLDFYKDKRIFITGHTGFKGAWLCKILHMAGAEIYGYSLEPPTEISLFDVANIGKLLKSSVIEDIRDEKKLEAAFFEARPEIVIHLAAQPIVREGYKEPHYTIETNVMGTLNLLECIRKSDTVRSFLNVTTDKVYKNEEWVWGYRETDAIGGRDPYSASKGAAEIITESYRKSYFEKENIAISTARAGNVIGGGDFGKDRIIPDCVSAVLRGEPITVRSPNSVRPYQHVLDALFAYLMIIEKQYYDKSYENNYNIGPMEENCVTTSHLVEMFINAWGDGNWRVADGVFPKESHILKLDTSRVRNIIGWYEKIGIKKAIDYVVEWTKAYKNGEDVSLIMEKEIKEYICSLGWSL